MPEQTNTAPTHTPINLAPGVDLMVRADMVDDPDTKVLVDHLVEHLDRGNREREIRNLIAHALTLPEVDAYNVLAHMLEMLGWQNKFTTRSASLLADAIEQLTPLASALEMVHACEGANFDLSALRNREAQS